MEGRERVVFEPAKDGPELLDEPWRLVDEAALAALQGLGAAQFRGDEKAVARAAWEIAEAFMAERERRTPVGILGILGATPTAARALTLAELCEQAGLVGDAARQVRVAADAGLSLVFMTVPEALALAGVAAGAYKPAEVLPAVAGVDYPHVVEDDVLAGVSMDQAVEALDRMIAEPPAAPEPFPVEDRHLPTEPEVVGGAAQPGGLLGKADRVTWTPDDDVPF